MRAQRIQLFDRYGFNRTARALPLNTEKKLVAGRQSDHSRSAPAEARRPQEIAIDGIDGQFFIGEDVVLRAETGVTAGERASRS